MLQDRPQRLLNTTEILHGANDLNLTLANASIYLEAFGHLVMSWIWLEQAIAAHAAQRGDQAFYAGKRQACDWFFRWELPRVDAQLDLLDSFDKTTSTMQDDWF